MKHLVATEPNELVSMDFTLLEMSGEGIENILVITDAFTKWTKTFPTEDQKAETVAKVLVKEWFYQYGVPRGYPQTKEETLRVKSLNNCVQCMALRNLEPHLTIFKAIVYVKDTTGPCTIF